MIDLQAMLADLELLVNTESPSLDVPRLTVSALALAGVMERRLGSAPSVIEGPAGPHVHWSGGGTPKVLIVGHHDTVFPVGSCAARPFTVAEGRATGPGIFDMKTGVVQAVHAVASLADRSGVEILITADEEVGSGTSRALIEERALACGNVLVCEASADGGALKPARKGTGGYEVVVHGRAAHAGLEPEKGINSLVAAAELILQINTCGDPTTATTVTPTVARAGTADNVVPAEARIRVDVRVEQPGEEDRLTAAFAALTTSVPGAIIEVTGGVDRPPMPSSASAALFAVAVAAGAAIG
ncbi:MAG: M20/M25/M40 family metallo-hydrolase, partial [Ilumatobacteraceae bacterium]|nr:M20/M25/M40 family metallo-hydrolase [Ilumatobacteraceae bacterium]